MQQAGYSGTLLMITGRCDFMNLVILACSPSEHTIKLGNTS